MNNYKPSDTQEATTKSVRCIETTDNDLFAELDNFRASTIEDKIEEYLKAPPIATVLGPLAWQYMMGDNPLAQMGCDFMSAPGMCSNLGL